MSFSVVCLKFSNTAVRSSRLLSFVPMFLTDDDSITSSFFKRSRISSSFSEKFAVISSTAKIVSSSAISSSVETVFRDFLWSGGEAESSELDDILFLLFLNSSVIYSAICRCGDHGFFKKIADSHNQRLYAAIARPRPQTQISYVLLGEVLVTLFKVCFHIAYSFLC